MPWLVIEDEITDERHVVPGVYRNKRLIEVSGHVLSMECSCGVHRDSDEPEVIVHEQFQ